MLAVILPATAFARPAPACGAMAQLPPCCCTPSRTRPAAPPQTTLRDQCCALVPVAIAEARPVASTVPVFELPAIAVASAAPSFSSPSARPVASRALAPPIVERSLFASRCALLL